MPVKPTESENEYFARLEIQRRLRAQAEKAQALAAEEKKRRKDLHFLHCPKCGSGLEEAVMERVTVDICPGCHGVWLDEGELDKLIAGHKDVFAAVRKIFS